MKKSFNLSLNSRTLEREMPKFKGVRLNLILRCYPNSKICSKRGETQ